MKRQARELGRWKGNKKRQKDGVEQLGGGSAWRYGGGGQAGRLEKAVGPIRNVTAT